MVALVENPGWRDYLSRWLETFPGIPDALKAIGVAMEAKRAPLEVLVVDSAEKTPTEN